MTLTNGRRRPFYSFALSRLLSETSRIRTCVISVRLKQRPQRHARQSAVAKFQLEFREAFLERPDAPAFALWEFFDRLDVAFVVERADVAEFDEVAVVLFFEPPQRQPLSPADVRPKVGSMRFRGWRAERFRVSRATK